MACPPPQVKWFLPFGVWPKAPYLLATVVFATEARSGC